MNRSTAELVAAIGIIGGAVILVIGAAVSLLGGDGWFFSILAPGVGFAFLLGGIAAALFDGLGEDQPRPILASICTIIAIVALVIGIWRVWPAGEHTQAVASSTPSENVDVVGSVPPMSRDLESDITAVQNALARMPAGQREAWLRQHYPHLAEGVEYYLRQNGWLRPSDRIERIGFMYGSLDGVRANSGTGDHRGFFRGKIIALVYVQGEPLPRAYALQCMNGLTEMPPGYESRLQALGIYTPNLVFDIGPREGLTRHVDYPLAINIAERFHLPVYRGRAQDERHRISYAAARALQSETARVQVTVGVVTGDHFDLERNIFTPSSARHH